MADHKKSDQSVYGSEEPRCDESFREMDGEENGLSGNHAEEPRVPEENLTDTQKESDNLEDRANGTGTRQKQTRTVGGDSRAGKAVTKLLAGLTVLTGAVLLLVNVVANRVPVADLKDFYVGADYIEYAFDIEGLTDGQTLILEVKNDYETYQFPVSAGTNSGTVSGLTPSTDYQFRVSGNFGYGTASLISKSVKTAGVAPEAVFKSLSYTVTDSGEVDLHYGVRFSDVEGKIEEAELVWLYADGTESGRQTLPPQNGDYDIPAFPGSGQVDFYLYATADGAKSLYATASLTLELKPEVGFELVDTGEGKQLRLRVLPMGSTLTSIRVWTEDTGFPFDRQLSAAEARSYTHLFTDWTDDSSHTVLCRVDYEQNGEAQTIELRRTAAASLDAVCKLVSVSDLGTEMTLTFDAFFDSARVERTDVLLSDGNRTVSVEGADLSSPVRIVGLRSGVNYTATVRFWADDLFLEVPLGTLTPDYPATVQPEVWVAEGMIVCTLKCDDPYGYYSGFTVAMTAEDASLISFTYDETRGVYVAPYAAMQRELCYVLTVSADTVRPSDREAGIRRAELCRQNVMD